jgi:hypothetical protein
MKDLQPIRPQRRDPIQRAVHMAANRLDQQQRDALLMLNPASRHPGASGIGC